MLTAPQIAKVVGPDPKPWMPKLFYSAAGEVWTQQDLTNVLPSIVEFAFIVAAEEHLRSLEYNYATASFGNTVAIFGNPESDPSKALRMIGSGENKLVALMSAIKTREST